MPKDRLFAEIENRLQGKLDPETFELCAADLLRTEHRGLTPIPGGSDGGMDGAVPTDGHPLPLIVTTADDVIGNLRRNLRRYKEVGGKARQAVVATSTKLSKKRWDNLHDQAEELGFRLRQIHDGTYFAVRLSRDPKWRRDLLNLSGELPALSTVPKSRRRPGPHVLIGRDAVVEQLLESNEDLVLVGQPGAGKTAVLQQLALDDAGLFLATDDFHRVADAVRELEPPIVFVDDAHRHAEQLVALCDLREKVGAVFRIVASSWPADSDRDRVRTALDVPKSSVIDLPLLPRQELAEVVKLCGIQDPPALVAEILDQAAGRPGLAVTISRYIQSEGTEDLIDGRLLVRDLRSVLDDLDMGSATAVLAAFAVGGKAGVPLGDVADRLGRPRDETWKIVVHTEAGGIIRQVKGSVLAVEPPALRWALVNEVFVASPSPFPLDDFVEEVCDPASTALTLSRALRRGVTVPETRIRRLLEAARPSASTYRSTTAKDAWQSYAITGPDAVDWILDAHPDLLEHVVVPALVQRPERVLPRLLAAAEDDHRPLNAHPEHPLRRIQDWVTAGRPGTPEAVDRRYTLLDAVETWLDGEQADERIALRAACSAFETRYEVAPTDPVTRSSVVFTTAFLTAKELEQVMERWPELLARLKAAGVDHLEPVRTVVRDWAFPHSSPGAVSEEAAGAARAGAETMLADVAGLAPESPGVVAWARRTADLAGLDVDLPDPPDPTFGVLYAPENVDEDWRERDRRRRDEAQSVGEEWAGRESAQVAEQVAWYQKEAERSGLTSTWWDMMAVEAMAEEIDANEQWLEAFVGAGCAARTVRPLLERSVERSDEVRFAWKLLRPHEEYRHILVSAVLRMADPPSDILSWVLDHVGGRARLVETLCIRGQLNQDRLCDLLNHDDPQVRRAAAKGIWRESEQGMVPEPISDDWRRVMVQAVESEYVLKQVFEARPDMAMEWIRERADAPPLSLWGSDGTIEAAVGALDRGMREQLVAEMPAADGAAKFFTRLVDRDVELYEMFLDRDELGSCHLDPLEGVPDDEWVPMAQLALEYGYETDAVARAAIPHSYTWSGDESDFLREWLDAFAELQDHDDHRVRKVGELGQRLVEVQVRKAEEREHREAVHGRIATR